MCLVVFVCGGCGLGLPGFYPILIRVVANSAGPSALFRSSQREEDDDNNNKGKNKNEDNKDEEGDKEEDDKVKTPEQLFDLYLKSVGRGANFLLNIPPDRRGLIHEIDSASLVEFKKLREENFKTNIAKSGTGYFVPHNGTRPAPRLNDGNSRSSENIYIPHLNSVGVEFKAPRTINCIVLKEDLSKGQNCKNFSLLLMNKKHELLKEIKGTTIGNKRIITFPSTELSIIGLAVKDQKGITAISEIAAYRIDDRLIEK